MTHSESEGAATVGRDYPLLVAFIVDGVVRAETQCEADRALAEIMAFREAKG